MYVRSIFVCILCCCVLSWTLTACPKVPVVPEEKRSHDSGPLKEHKPPTENKIDASNPPYGLTQRVKNTSCLFKGRPDALTSMKLVSAFPNLRFNRGLFLTHAGGDNQRLFVVEQGGRVHMFANHSSVKQSEVKVFLDIRDRVSRDNNEEGLLGFAFHPNYANNGYMYVYYSAAAPRRSIISRFTRKPGTVQVDPSTEHKILEIRQPYGNHNGGMLAFGPDGYLYISVGDGGAAGDPHGHGQNLSTLLGSILRIDINRKDSGLNYAVPKDNPFVDKAGARKEIWAYGLRNVWRMSFDRDTGHLWAGDVGQRAWEEIDRIVRGGNYGWKAMEGKHCYDPQTNCKKPGMIEPIVEHPRNEARSITGGYVYRGKKLKTLKGAYIYADFVTGIVWALRHDGRKLLEHKQIVQSNKKIASFGEDASGELYILTFEGEIYHLQEQSGGQPNTFPLLLSQTGCFKTLQPLVPADGVIPYDVQVPLWSDHLDKTRWFALPGDQKIIFTQKDGWNFPDGSVAIKHFAYNATKGDPSTRYNVETRFLIKSQGEWRGYTYRWDSSQKDASLTTSRRNVDIRQKRADGTFLNFTHIIPSSTDCMYCHSQEAGRVLGLETAQMNRSFDYKNATDNQLRTLEHIGIFTKKLPLKHTSLPKLAPLHSTQVSLETRVRSYLHANCSFCHRPGSQHYGDIDLRYSTPLKKTNICDRKPLEGHLGLSDPRVVAPQKPQKSILLLRMSRRASSTGQMPPIGSVLKDQKALVFIQQWIQELKTCP